MNKAEKQQFDDLTARLERAEAFRRTPAVRPDVLPSDIPNDRQSPDFLSGFVFNSESSMTVWPAWTQKHFHSIGSSSPDETRSRGCSKSQNGLELYLTRKLALQALRHAIEETAAKRLTAIDKLIAAEL